MRDLFTPHLESMLAAATSSVAQTGLRIVLVILAAAVGVRVLKAVISRLDAMLVLAGARTESVPGAARRRVATLTGIIRTLALVVLWAMAAVVCLSQVGLDVRPILAGAGIVGLAVGFGAQNLVRDVISGFFLVLENQVRVGDVAVVNGTGGLVETITFRTIVLRDLAGAVHVFPNGAVTTLANMTMGWSAYVVDVGVDYTVDTDRVVEVMRQVAEEMRQDPSYGPVILEPIEVFGVDDFKASTVNLKARLKTQAMEQWRVGREYRRRLKKALEATGIRMPSAHQALYIEQTSKPLEVLLARAGETTSARSG